MSIDLEVLMSIGMSIGRAFHTEGALIEKALSPSLLNFPTLALINKEFEDLSDLEGL